jgi:hypothetical protein
MTDDECWAELLRPLSPEEIVEEMKRLDTIEFEAVVEDSGSGGFPVFPHNYWNPKPGPSIR